VNIKTYLQSASGRLFLGSFGLYVAGTGAMAVNGPVDSSWAIYSLMFALLICGGIYCLGNTTHGSGLSAAGLVLFGPILAPGFIVIAHYSTEFGAGPGYAMVALGSIIMLAGLLRSGGTKTSVPVEAEAS
jgi:peptidoglycan/LPS O-acetylase OafA/YrhL